MELTNFSFLNAKNHYSSSLAAKNQSVNRIGNGNRLNSPGVDAGALSVSMKLSSKQKVITGKMSGIQNTLSYLKTQEGAINSAMNIMDRIAQLKTLASSPTLSLVDKSSYNKEFIELSDQLNSLKQKSFNKISLFSEIETGAGLFSASTESLNQSSENGATASISRHVIDFEDLRYITEAGDAAKRGFGGIDIAYFPSTDSQKQQETITIDGNIGNGDVFRFSIRELSALMETESDTDFEHIATSDNEDPEFVRDTLFDKITGDPNIMKFLDVIKDGDDSFIMTAKMNGDPYLVHSFGSTGSTGFMSQETETPGTLNNAQEDTLTIDLGTASLLSGDQISVIVNGEPISYTATPGDESSNRSENFLATRIAMEINNNVNLRDDIMAKPNYNGPGSVVIFSKVRGTPFSTNSPSLTLSSVNKVTSSFTSITTSPNSTGTKKEVAVTIAPDDSTPGGGKIAVGDYYNIRITEEHPDETSRRYNFFRSQFQDYTLNVTNADMTNDQIRDRLVTMINNRGDSIRGSYDAIAGASGELIISERNAGDTFSVELSWGSSDDLYRTKNEDNVSPFSIESSMNFLTQMLSKNGAEQSRLNVAHENLQNHYTFGESALSRISDSDTAREATNLAKSALKMNLATQVMSNTTRMTDLLTPLTTNHFRSYVLSATL